MNNEMIIKNKENLQYYTDEVIYLFMKACIERKKPIINTKVVFC